VPYAYNEDATVPDKKGICISCHTKDRWSGLSGMAGAKDVCAVCHMSHTVSGGMPATFFMDSTGNGYYPHSSVRSHVFYILAHPILSAADTMYDPSLVTPYLKKNTSGKTFMTQDRSCISCHDGGYHAIHPTAGNIRKKLDSLGKLDMLTFPLDPNSYPPQ
jgi:hypothetical protein